MTESFMTPEERLAALEQLEIRQQRNQRRAVWAAWGSIGVAMVVLGVLISSIFLLNRESARLTRNNSDLEKQIEIRKGELAEQLKQLRSSKEELAQAQDILAGVRQKLGTDNVPEAKRIIAESGATIGKATPRIYIHIRSANQGPIANQLASQFTAKGYSVPKAEILVDKGPVRSEIRYFHQNEEERKEAAELAREVSGGAGVRYIPGFENSPLVKPRQFELWLGPGS